MERDNLRIAIVDESAARAAVIEEGLQDAGLRNVTIFTDRHGIAARLETLSPDVVLINLANPHRDELEELFALSRAMARPVAMFVDQSDIAGIEAAIDAGVSAYVVDGLKKEHTTPVLMVENASLPNERLVATRLDMLEFTAAPALTDGPAVLIVGAAMYRCETPIGVRRIQPDLVAPGRAGIRD